jgi:hypothetical protein
MCRAFFENGEALPEFVPLLNLVIHAAHKRFEFAIDRIET